MTRSVRLALAATLAATSIVGAGFLITFATGQQTDLETEQQQKDEARALALGFPKTSFNLKTVRAQQRGCNACHGDYLAEATSNLEVRRSHPELHGIFVAGYDVAMTVEDCMICHRKDKPRNGIFAGTIHSSHLHSKSFTNMGGNCDSCHAIDLKGEWVLYDNQSRYGLMNGIKSTPTPEFSPP
jgi:Outer membrane cytochrome MtrC/MtrF-like, domains II/IV